MLFNNKLVAKNKQGTLILVHTDCSDSPVAHINAAGAVLERMHYQPFGTPVVDANDDAGYTGHKYDSELGLNYMQARYYDPVIGRFYSNDPVGVVEAIRRGSSVQGLNRYAYVQNNPYKYVVSNGEWLSIAIRVIRPGINAYKANKK
jgi:RHS repeat-associated protein